MPSAVPPLSQDDYETIESAVMETTRGRWFLDEYARRHRQADTEMLLSAMGRLENVVRGESVASVDRVRSGLMEMSAAIARTKADIAALKAEGETGHIEEATEELDSIVSATETATSDILAAAEHVQEIAWTLRERPLDPSHCDTLDSLATDIYTACSFQDLTGQRTRQVISVMRYLESRIEAMIDLWGRAETGEAAPERPQDAERALLNGPARPGEGLDQSDIDSMLSMEPPLFSLSDEGEAEVPLASVRKTPEPIIVDDVMWVATDDVDEFPELEPDAPSVDASLQLDAVMAEDDEAEAPSSSPDGSDPLAPLAALSGDEKIALFT